MKSFSQDLKEHVTEIISYQKQKKPQTDQENKSYLNQEICYICRKRFSTDDGKRKYHEVRDYCHYAEKYRKAAHNICNLRYKTQKEIPVIFHCGFIYNYHSIINELAKEGNTVKYITFSVPIEEELDNKKAITHKLKFIDSFRFMSTSLLKLANNLSEIYSKKCRDKNCKSKCEFKGLKNKLKLSYNWKNCRNIQLKPINGLIKKFSNTNKFCNNDINYFLNNKFILLLKKGVYPYEYMVDSWGRFDETMLRNKKAFYCELNLEDIADEDYIHDQKVFQEFELKHLGEYHDLYVQSDALLLIDVFKNFRNKYIEIYELDPVHFLFAPGLAW